MLILTKDELREFMAIYESLNGERSSRGAGESKFNSEIVEWMELRKPEIRPFILARVPVAMRRDK